MELTEARVRIEKLDGEILALFMQRMEVVREIENYKYQHGLGIFDPVREAQRMRAASVLGGKEFSECTCCLMEEMLSISRDYQVNQMRKRSQQTVISPKP